MPEHEYVVALLQGELRQLREGVRRWTTEADQAKANVDAYRAKRLVAVARLAEVEEALATLGAVPEPEPPAPEPEPAP